MDAAEGGARRDNGDGPVESSGSCSWGDYLAPPAKKVRRSVRGRCARPSSGDPSAGESTLPRWILTLLSPPPFAPPATASTSHPPRCKDLISSFEHALDELLKAGVGIEEYVAAAQILQNPCTLMAYYKLPTVERKCDFIKMTWESRPKLLQGDVLFDKGKMDPISDDEDEDKELYMLFCAYCKLPTVERKCDFIRMTWESRPKLL